MISRTLPRRMKQALSAVAAATLFTLTVGGVPQTLAKEPTAEDIARCEAETAAYNNTWAQGWARHNNRPASEAPPPVPYKCGPVPDNPAPQDTPDVPDAPDAPTINIPDIADRDTTPRPTAEPGMPGGGIQHSPQTSEPITHAGDTPSVAPQAENEADQPLHEVVSCKRIANRAARTMLTQPSFQHICNIAGATIYPYEGRPFRLEAIPPDKVSYNSSKPIAEEGTQAYIDESNLSNKSAYRPERRFSGFLGYREKDKKRSWSREYSFTASNSINQRLYQTLGVKGNSLDFPDDAIVELVFEVRKDVTGPDKSVGTESASTKLNGGTESSVDIEMPKGAGSYFAKVKVISITIPSWGFSPSPFGVDQELGRQTCNEWKEDGGGGTCIFKDY